MIDLRSDTVTRPTDAMRRAMARAEVGDDVLGDDFTVMALQEKVAALMGTEAALFVPSGTMANQLAIRAQCEPGDEVICHKDNHIIHYETGGPAALSGVMIRPADGPLGQWGPDLLNDLVREPNAHNPFSKLIVLENTHNRGGGSVWHVAKVQEISEAARGKGLKMHLDGARLWNACIASGRKPGEYAKHFDTISCCFSKGLGAPVGSAVCGTEAIVARMHRFRKMFGGAMRQSGILAAAAIYAMDNHYDRLEKDHHHARLLSMGLSEITGLDIAMPVATNMVFIDINAAIGSAGEFCGKLKTHGVLALPSAGQRIRLVTHLDITKADIESTIIAFGKVTGTHQTGKRRRTQKELTKTERSRAGVTPG